MRAIKFCLLILLTSTLLFSCKDDKNDEEETGVDFPADMQAVWQQLPDDDGDDIGLYFEGDSIWFWDFQGDAFDQGDDCFENLRIAELVSVTGDVYRIQSLFDNGEASIRITYDDISLTISDPEGTAEDNSEFMKDELEISGLLPLCPPSSAKTTAADDKRKTILFR